MDRIFQINGFDGGESDDIIKGPANSFYSGENIEVRQNLSAAKLSPRLTDTGWVFDDNISFMANLETLGVDGGGIVVCLENGKIFLDGVLKTTLASASAANNRIKGIGVNTVTAGTQYVYYISQTIGGGGKIHRSTTDLSTFNLDYKSYTVTSGTVNFVGTINDSGLLYIAVKNKVLLLDDTETVQDYLALPTNETCVGFTQFQGNFKVYTNSETTGVQYIWNGAAEAPDYRQEWINQPILGVVNDGAFDYAVLGFNENYSDLYLISGTQKQELRVNLETASYSRLLNGYLSIREGIVYISGGKTGQSDNYGIYTYGNYYPGAKNSLAQSYSLSTSAFLYHAHSIATSYYACADDKVYKIDNNIPPALYATSGYIVTNLYQGYLWEEKAFNYMKIGFKLNGGEIKIYARTSMSLTSETTWTLIKTIDNATYGSKKSLRLDANELNNNGKSLGTFNELQFKFELTPGGSGTTTPELYSSATWLKVINNN